MYIYNKKEIKQRNLKQSSQEGRKKTERAKESKFR